MVTIIENKTFSNKKYKKITLENKEFVNCSFSGFNCYLEAKNVVFRNCIFKDCNLFCSFNKVEIVGGEIIRLDIYRANIYNLTIKNCSIEESSLSNSFVSLLTFRYNKAKRMNFIAIFVDNSSLDSNEFENLRLCSSSFSGTFFRRNKIKGNVLKNVIKKTYFNNSCFFENTDFFMIYEENSNFSKNTVLGTFENCQNKDRLGVTSPCPVEGSFIGYKKCWCYVENYIKKDCIVTLKICEDAKRFGQNSSRKCRCSKAEVIKIEDMEGNEIAAEAYSYTNVRFSYEVGKIVKPNNEFDENEEVECSSGIHFFMSKKEAQKYDMW